MRIDFLTLFPEMCKTVMDESIIGRAQKKGAVEICYHQIRDYANNKHNRVDDPPFGGGMGMLLRAEPLALCMDDVIKQLGKKPYFIYMSPLGSVLTQQKAIELSQKENIAILCGHYEGIDERIIDDYIDEQISIGDYVLTGGELPALVMADAICRMLPDVLSDNVCFEEESHYNGLWSIRNIRVPQILEEGSACRIAVWTSCKYSALEARAIFAQNCQISTGFD
ncbi:MAG: tRNA (guanosine(37)-N1)-methyltransferase TrmD [Acutalibacteraceae bacterium]